MKTLVGFLVLMFVTGACGPLSNNEAEIKPPKNYPGKDKYTSPDGIGEEEIEKVTPGTTTGPKELLIDGQPILFPVHGPNRFDSDFGAPRKGHTHQGNDIIAKWMTPVVAIADGQVLWVYGKGKKCCSIAIGHDSGWNSRYIHLNNDIDIKKNDGKGNGVAPHLKVGTRVRAGELIGWVGNSGNAEGGTPHLHFEIRYYERPINPHAALVESRRLPLTQTADVPK